MAMIDSDSFRQQRYAALGRTISRPFFHRDEPKHRTDVDDRAPSGFAKFWEGGAAHQEWTF